MPAAIAGVVDAIMTHAAAAHRPIHEIQRRWRRAVGASLAARSRPVSVRRGVLAVEVDDPGTAYALSLRTPAALRALAHDGGPAVQELVIRAGGRAGTKKRG